MSSNELRNTLVERLLEKLIERLEDGENIDAPSYAIASLDAWDVVAGILDGCELSNITGIEPEDIE